MRVIRIDRVAIQDKGGDVGVEQNADTIARSACGGSKGSKKIVQGQSFKDRCESLWGGLWALPDGRGRDTICVGHREATTFLLVRGRRVLVTPFAPACSIRTSVLLFPTEVNRFMAQANVSSLSDVVIHSTSPHPARAWVLVGLDRVYTIGGLVERTGIEPVCRRIVTPAAGISPTPHWNRSAPGQNRTGDLRVRSRCSFLLSYGGAWSRTGRLLLTRRAAPFGSQLGHARLLGSIAGLTVSGELPHPCEPPYGAIQRSPCLPEVICAGNAPDAPYEFIRMPKPSPFVRQRENGVGYARMAKA